MPTSSTFLVRFREFACTPEGRRVFAEARKLAKDPGTQRRIDAVRRTLVGSAGEKR